MKTSAGHEQDGVIRYGSASVFRMGMYGGSERAGIDAVKDFRQRAHGTDG